MICASREKPIKYLIKYDRHRQWDKCYGNLRLPYS